MSNWFVYVILGIQAFILLAFAVKDARNQRRFELTRTYYGEDNEKYRLNGIDVAPEIVSLMLGRYAVQMQQVTDIDPDGVIVHNFTTISGKSLPSA